MDCCDREMKRVMRLAMRDARQSGSEDATYVAWHYLLGWTSTVGNSQYDSCIPLFDKSYSSDMKRVMSRAVSRAQQIESEDHALVDWHYLPSWASADPNYDPDPLSNDLHDGGGIF